MKDFIIKNKKLLLQTGVWTLTVLILNVAHAISKYSLEAILNYKDIGFTLIWAICAFMIYYFTFNYLDGDNISQE